MRSHALFEPIVTKFCMWCRVVDMVDMMNGAKLFRNRLKGSEFQDPQTI